MAEPAMTVFDQQVLEMIAGRRRPETGAWVNACAEWLADNGYVTRDYRAATDKGRAYLDSRS